MDDMRWVSIVCDDMEELDVCVRLYEQVLAAVRSRHEVWREERRRDSARRVRSRYCEHGAASGGRCAPCEADLPHEVEALARVMVSYVEFGLRADALAGFLWTAWNNSLTDEEAAVIAAVAGRASEWVRGGWAVGWDHNWLTMLAELNATS